ncbi:hypothetical protein ACFSDD_24085 [Salipiger marinus]|uniref:CobQ/CobB/MinD/ParA nucleotide binding domain-containing protein n=1 Tax=Salipiger marinus TaxID=555512 RepID=A0A1G8TE39_9RHOB|nr:MULTISPECIES: hypothetical protein [Salipiger]MCD1619301.1 ParA family protein [Salipiger manganoxidans]MEB3421588.1 hypothetical protein [Salipiger manganoxidans]SDJ39836.1 CobQ/CobB/MinD/ParA nucleotide binding domain-containing protein [Salipiger marinus]
MTEFSHYMCLTSSMKGGGGKSTLACTLLDFLRRHDVEVAAYDADGAIGTLSDMHAARDADGRPHDPQTPLEGVVAYNIRDESRALLFNSLAAGHRHILHDVAGGALADMQRLFGDENSLRNFFRALRSAHACVIFFHVVTPDVSTIESVALHLDLTEKLGDLAGNARHVAVLNRHGDRQDRDFPHWFGYTDAAGVVRGGKTRARLMSCGGAEMFLPALNDRTMSMLKELRRPFAKAVYDPALSFIDQQRVQIFMEDFENALTADVRGMLGLSA